MKENKKILVVFVLLILLGFISYFFYSKNISRETGSEPVSVANTSSVSFAWKYEKAQSLNLDGLPETNVFLEATYPKGEIERKLVDTTPGGCNDLPEVDQDSVSGSANAQCYSAGLGYRYKITRGPQKYLVMRKTFEEGLPDYTPPPYEYEVVAEFTLYK